MSTVTGCSRSIQVSMLKRLHRADSSSFPIIPLNHEPSSPTLLQQQARQSISFAQSSRWLVPPAQSSNQTSALHQDVEVMPEERHAIKQGMMYKLTSGQVKKWEQRDLLLTDSKFCYSIDSNASKAWNRGLRVAESIPLLEIEKVVSAADVTDPGFVSRWRQGMGMDSESAKMKELEEKVVCPTGPIINHRGFVKHRDRVTLIHPNTAFETSFFVLSDAVLEFYEDDKAHLVNKDGGLKGSILTRNVKVTSSSSGVDKSNNGYHFTIEDTSSGKVIESVCEDAVGRDMWVQKIQASYHNSTVKDEKVTMMVYIKSEENDDIGRIHYFHAANEQECLSWTKALQLATVNARQNKFLTPTPAWTRIQAKVMSLYTSDLVQYTIVGLILANFFCNIVEFELMAEELAIIHRFDDVDRFFTILFTLELIVNLIAHIDILPFPFLLNMWNILDVVIVGISLASLTSGGDNSAGVKAIRVMRAFRVARVFKRLNALRLVVQALMAAMYPVMTTFFVMLISTSVYAILGVGLFSERPGSSAFFGHFSVAVFTMFQVVSGDGWASDIARPMFVAADESTCTYYDADTGHCNFDVGVAIFFLSYILVVVTVVLNVVLAVLLDEFLKAQDQQKNEILIQSHYTEGALLHFSGALDPFLKYLSEFLNSNEMPMRVEEAFNFLDYNNTGFVDFMKLKVGLERLNLHPKVKLLEEDWRDITNDGELCGDNHTLTSQQFFEVMRNQVTLYVQRRASKSLWLNQELDGKDIEQNNTFVLKYLVTAMDDLRSAVKSLHNSPYTSSEYHGQGKSGGLEGCAKQKRRQGLKRESASSHGPIMPETKELQKEMRNDVEDYSAKGAGCQGVTHMEREDLALETAMTPALIRRGPAPGNDGITVFCASQLLREQPNARSTFVEGAAESKTTSTDEVGTLKEELVALRQSAVDMALRESKALRESEELRSKTKTFCQDFPDNLLCRMKMMMVELTAEYFHDADGCDASGLKDGRRQRPLYQMNSTKAVPDAASKGTPSYERPVASKEINLTTPPTCFERKKLDSLPLRAPSCLDLNQHAEIPVVGAKETVMGGNDLGHSTFLQPPTADASEHITNWMQCKESPSCSTTALNPLLSTRSNSFPCKGGTRSAIKGEGRSDLTTSLSTEEGKDPSPVLAVSHRSFGEVSIAHHGEFERTLGAGFILGAGCVCEQKRVGEVQLSPRTSVRHLGSRRTDVGGVQQPETGSYVPENGAGSPVSTVGDKNIYHELIAELQDVEIHFGDTETAHNARRGLTAGT